MTQQSYPTFHTVNAENRMAIILVFRSVFVLNLFLIMSHPKYFMNILLSQLQISLTIQVVKYSKSLSLAVTWLGNKFKTKMPMLL